MILSYDSYLILERSKLDYEKLLRQNESEVVSDLFGTVGTAAIAGATAAGVGSALLIGSGIKTAKIKKQLKSYQQLVMKDVAIDIDYLNKKKGPSWDKLSSEQKDTIDDAKAKMKAAIDEELALVNDRISSLTTNSYLEKIASNGKLKAKLLAAKELSKYAEGEYRATLRQRAKSIQTEIQKNDSEIKELEAEAKEKEAAAKKSESGKKNEPAANKFS